MSGPVKHRTVTPLIQFIQNLGRGVSNDTYSNYVIFFLFFNNVMYYIILLINNNTVLSTKNYLYEK